MLNWMFRRGSDQPVVYTPHVPRDGFPAHVPPAVLRIVRKLRDEMSRGRPDRVTRLQYQLATSKWPVPTTVEECDSMIADLERKLL